VIPEGGWESTDSGRSSSLLRQPSCRTFGNVGLGLDFLSIQAGHQLQGYMVGSSRCKNPGTARPWLRRRKLALSKDSRWLLVCKSDISGD
jgi:hypothetical protein